jgi:hypothetical protein
LIKFRRITPGRYQSDDNRIIIQREVSRQTRHADEICWSLTVDGKTKAMHYDTMKEAKEAIVKG